MAWIHHHRPLLLTKFTPFQNLEIWIFGSALTKDNPKDIDVLIVYKDKLSTEDREKIKTLEQEPFMGLNYHFTFLSTIEMEEDLDFINNVKGSREFLCGTRF